MSRGWASIATLAGMALVAGGATVAVVLTDGPVPDGVERFVLPSSVPASVTSFADERSVAGTPVVDAPATLVLQDSGTLTVSACTAGGLIASGTSPVTVDDRPVLALATGIPLWRDLGTGSRGDDVRAVQSELLRLGQPIEVTGTYDTRTHAAVQAMLRSIGARPPSTGLLRSTLLWIPAPSVTLSTCERSAGAVVVAGELLATTTGALTGVRVAVPAGIVEGPRTVTVEGASAALPLPGEDGLTVVSDPGLLATVAASPAFALLQADVTRQSTLPLTIRLSEPEELLAVPPVALSALSADRACLTLAGVPRPVVVVASRLGHTMVRLPEGVDPPVEVDVVPDATC